MVAADAVTKPRAALAAIEPLCGDKGNCAQPRARLGHLISASSFDDIALSGTRQAIERKQQQFVVAGPGLQKMASGWTARPQYSARERLSIERREVCRLNDVRVCFRGRGDCGRRHGLRSHR